MNTTLRRIAGMFFAMALTSHLMGQLEFINLEKILDYRQTDAGVVPTTFEPGSPPTAAAYQFRITVEGATGMGSTSISGFPTPTFTPPGTSNFTNPPGTLLFNSDDNSWSRRLLFPNKYVATGGPGNGPHGLDGIINNGAFSLTINGLTGTLNLGTLGVDTYANAPEAVVTAGTWSSSGLTLNAGEAFQLSLASPFANWETNGALFNHIGIFIGGNDDNDIADISSFSSAAPADLAIDEGEDNYNGDGSSPTFLIDRPMGLAAGTYFVEMEFNSVMDLNTDDFGAPAVALFTTRTQFMINVQAIPEPSTYAVIFGALALAGVVVRRRRRAV